MPQITGALVVAKWLRCAELQCSSNVILWSSINHKALLRGPK